MSYCFSFWLLIGGFIRCINLWKRHLINDRWIFPVKNFQGNFKNFYNSILNKLQNITEG